MLSCSAIPGGLRLKVFALPILFGASLSACGGGATSSGSAATARSGIGQVSTLGALPAACSGVQPSGTSETFAGGTSVQPQTAAAAGADLVAVWEQDRWSGVGSRAIAASRSNDGGVTWTAPDLLPFSACTGVTAYDRASDPWIGFAGNGTLVASALAFSANNLIDNGAAGASAILISRSTDGGVTWSAPLKVWEDVNSGPVLYFNDRDSVTADPASGNVYVVWDRISSAGGSTPAYMGLLTQRGSTLANAGLLYDPGGAAEAFNNQIAVLPDGTVLDFFTLLGATNTLQVIRVTVTGNSWSVSAPTTVATLDWVDTPDPTPAATPIRDSYMMAQIAVDPASGAVAAVWEQDFAGASFDGIALSISTDGGVTWSGPRQINGAPGAAAFNPTVRYLPGGVLAVTYYDLRGYVTSSSTLSTTPWLSESADGGVTWHEVPLQSPFDLMRATLTDNSVPFGISPALFLGDNQGLTVSGGNAVPIFSATDIAGTHVYAAPGPQPLKTPGAHIYPAL